MPSTNCRKSPGKLFLMLSRALKRTPGPEVMATKRNSTWKMNWKCTVFISGGGILHGIRFMEENMPSKSMTWWQSSRHIKNMADCNVRSICTNDISAVIRDGREPELRWNGVSCSWFRLKDASSSSRSQSSPDDLDRPVPQRRSWFHQWPHRCRAHNGSKT